MGGEEERASTLVFIGKNLDRDGLKAGFTACRAPKDFLEQKKKQLRFAVDASVECKTGPGDGKRSWSSGKVVGHMYRDDDMSPGFFAPYQVRLENGDLVLAPADSDDAIRSLKRKAKAMGAPEKARKFRDILKQKRGKSPR